MSMMLDLIWLDSGAIEYRAACAQCSFRAGPFDDEDTARWTWFGHVCVRTESPVPA
jgi:hypothetical protein